MSAMPSNMKAGWWSIELPEFRPHPKLSTYSLFSYSDLPPIVEEIDDDFHWLKSQSVKESSLIEGSYPDGGRPNLTKLDKIASEYNLKLPMSFTTFIHSTELHERIRSCTDCYLDLADRAVRTKGTIQGCLVHFLSDSQWVLHWYIHVDPFGNHFVATSPNAYGFTFDDIVSDAHASYQKSEIDLQGEEIWFCARTFNEFIYRFWLENEIWYALALEERPLTVIEQTYVAHYSSRNSTTT